MRSAGREAGPGSSAHLRQPVGVTLVGNFDRGHGNLVDSWSTLSFFVLSDSLVMSSQSFQILLKLVIVRLVATPLRQSLHCMLHYAAEWYKAVQSVFRTCR